MRPTGSAGRVLVGAVLALALAGCADAAGNGATSYQAAGKSETATVSGGIQHLTVDAGDDLAFAQTDLHAHTGTIEITLVSTGQMSHDLLFSDGPQGGTSEVRDGSASVTLSFPTPGTYHFVCTVHARMRGTLTVS